MYLTFLLIKKHPKTEKFLNTAPAGVHSSTRPKMGPLKTSVALKTDLNSHLYIVHNHLSGK